MTDKQKELDEIDAYLKNNDLDIDQELGALQDDERLLKQLKTSDELGQQQHDDSEQPDLNTLMQKVEVGQDEAQQLFNDMLQNLEGRLDVEDSTDLRAQQFLKKQPGKKYESLDNLRENVKQEIVTEGYAKQ